MDPFEDVFPTENGGFFQFSSHFFSLIGVYHHFLMQKYFDANLCILILQICLQQMSQLDFSEARPTFPGD